jgi:anti-sigma factor RsiW
MKCEELLKALNDYVDGDLDPAVCGEFEQHLAGCNPCQVVVDNIRKTIRLYKDGQSFEIPVELCQKLRTSLRERWKQKYQ